MGVSQGFFFKTHSTKNANCKQIFINDLENRSILLVMFLECLVDGVMDGITMMNQSRMVLYRRHTRIYIVKGGAVRRRAVESVVEIFRGVGVVEKK